MKRREIQAQPTLLFGLLVFVLVALFVAVQSGPAAAADTLAKLKSTKYALLASYNEPPHD